MKKLPPSAEKPFELKKRNTSWNLLPPYSSDYIQFNLRCTKWHIILPFPLGKSIENDRWTNLQIAMLEELHTSLLAWPSAISKFKASSVHNRDCQIGLSSLHHRTPEGNFPPPTTPLLFPLQIMSMLASPLHDEPPSKQNFPIRWIFEFDLATLIQT